MNHAFYCRRKVHLIFNLNFKLLCVKFVGHLWHHSLFTFCFMAVVQITQMNSDLLPSSSSNILILLNHSKLNKIGIPEKLDEYISCFRQTHVN